MSPSTWRVIKAVWLIASLSVSEARQGSEASHAERQHWVQSENEGCAYTKFEPLKALAMFLLAHGPSALRLPSLVACSSLSQATLQRRHSAAWDSQRLQPSTSITSLMSLRGGADFMPSSLTSHLRLPSTPTSWFNCFFLVLASVAAMLKVSFSDSPASANLKPPAVRALELRYLSVFWLLRMADWLQGPYFYEVYSSKVVGGSRASLELVSKLFLTGFGATAIFGPAAGRFCEKYGRKLGTLGFTLCCAASALSTESPLLWVLFLGRLAGGIGTSLLFSAPEAWLVGDAQRVDAAGYLGGIFGAAYAGDAIIAIIAGQIAEQAATLRGPCGPFEVSTLFLAAGAAGAVSLWRENKAEMSASSSEAGSGASVREAAEMLLGDKKMLFVGLVQALFEAAIYVFVLQWPPAISATILRVFGDSATTPFGTVFSCFMVCCFLGSTVYGALAKWRLPTEVSTLMMLGVASVAMAAAASGTALGLLFPLVAAFFLFETCVGMYFPLMGTLHSKYIPDSQRSVITNLFRIPLNVLVAGLFLSTGKLGTNGALAVATAALGFGTASMSTLLTLSKDEGIADNTDSGDDDYVDELVEKD